METLRCVHYYLFEGIVCIFITRHRKTFHKRFLLMYLLLFHLFNSIYTMFKTTEHKTYYELYVERKASFCRSGMENIRDG